MSILYKLSIGLIVYLFIFINCEKRYTNKDLEMVAYLGKKLHIRCVLFVEDSRSLVFPQQVRTISENLFFSSAISSSHLKSIISNASSEKNFFQTRTMLVTKEALNLTEILNMVTKPYFLTWIILRNYRNYEMNLFIPVSSEVLFVDSTTTTKVVEQVHHLKSASGKIVEIVKSWAVGGDEFVIDTQVPKGNFQNITLDMLVLHNHTVCQDFHGKSIMRKMECQQQDILMLISYTLNFSLNTVECVEKIYPHKYPNGSFGELYNRLRNNNVDVSAATYVVFSKRFDFVDFVWPTFVLKSMMYLKQIRLTSYWNAYLRPLESSLWWVILIWIISSGTILQIFEIIIKESPQRIPLILNFVNSLLKSLQIFCSQGTREISTWNSIRIIYTLKFFVVLMFLQAYCGYLVSSLTVLEPYFPFMDLKGFLANENYRLSTLSKGYTLVLFKYMLAENFNRKFLLDDAELPNTVEEGIDILCTKDSLVYVEFREDMLNVNKFKCKIAEIPRPVSQQYMGLGLPPNSPYRELLQRQLIHLQNIGLMQRFISRLSSHSELSEYDDGYQSVSILQTFSIFCLLGFGTITSVFLFLFEVLTKHFLDWQKVKFKKTAQSGSGRQWSLQPKL